MLPTLFGRIQTRIFATLVIGGLWQLILGPFLPIPGIPDGFSVPLGDKYEALFRLLVLITILGVLWELVYHGLQQFRWEKDWPTLFGFVTFINEGLLAFGVCRAGLAGDDLEFIPKTTFAVGFLTTWVVVWLFVNGPMRIFNVHWRFQGGRLV